MMYEHILPSFSLLTAFQLQHSPEVIQIMVQAAAVLLLCDWFPGPIFVRMAYSSEASTGCYP